MLLVIELGSDVMQNIVCNTKSIIFVTVITIPCKTIRKKKNDNKKKVMQKFLEFFYHLSCVFFAFFHTCHGLEKQRKLEIHSLIIIRISLPQLPPGSFSRTTALYTCRHASWPVAPFPRNITSSWCCNEPSKALLNLQVGMGWGGFGGMVWSWWQKKGIKQKQM